MGDHHANLVTCFACCAWREMMEVDSEGKAEMDRIKCLLWSLESAEGSEHRGDALSILFRLSLHLEAKSYQGAEQEMCVRGMRTKCLEWLERRRRDSGRRESEASSGTPGEKIGANVSSCSPEEFLQNEEIKKLITMPGTPSMSYRTQIGFSGSDEAVAHEGCPFGGQRNRGRPTRKRGPPLQEIPSGDLHRESQEKNERATKRSGSVGEQDRKDEASNPSSPTLEAPVQGGGFVTARTKLIAEHKKKGNVAAAAELEAVSKMANDMFPSGHRYASTRRDRHPGKAQQGGVGRGGFVPPFMKKAMDASGAGGENEAGPISQKHMELLMDDNGELPEPLCNMDPKIIEQVCHEIMDRGGRTSWEDIAGQDEAKQLIKELVVWPMMNVELFRGARAPPKGLLLFGPPGTGKTLIGKAVAGNINATFFNISASSLTSKWIGEGEKMVRALFAVAGRLQPSVIFIDEIDSLLSARKAEGEHEASRRLKTEFLVQMEGCDSNSAERRVLLIGATNRPEELDEAARRRLPKQLYVPLPCQAARRQMVLRTLREVKSSLSEEDLVKLVSKTDGYSGSDMRNLIQEACQGPVRDVMVQRGESAVVGLTDGDLRPVVLKDFQKASRAQRASVSPEEIERYEVYNRKHGANYIAAEDAEDMEDEW